AVDLAQNGPLVRGGEGGDGGHGQASSGCRPRSAISLISISSSRTCLQLSLASSGDIASQSTGRRCSFFIAAIAPRSVLLAVTRQPLGLCVTENVPAGYSMTTKAPRLASTVFSNSTTLPVSRSRHLILMRWLSRTSSLTVDPPGLSGWGCWPAPRGAGRGFRGARRACGAGGRGPRSGGRPRPCRAGHTRRTSRAAPLVVFLGSRTSRVTPPGLL